MTAFIKFFVFIIIVWRITHLISSEDGPFDLIFKLRKLAGQSFFGKLMDCFYCMSIWTGLAGAAVAGSGWKEIIILTLYYSGSAMILEKLTNRNNL